MKTFAATVSALSVCAYHNSLSTTEQQSHADTQNESEEETSLEETCSEDANFVHWQEIIFLEGILTYLESSFTGLHHYTTVETPPPKA